MKKKVSVIIPFYNGVDWLFEAVQSVFDQTYKNFEIIVVNDGSQEDVSKFLEKYSNKIIYRYKENGGAATARNLAMEIATGDYIAFLDSDDVWLPTKTEKQIAFMEEIGVMWSHTGYYNWFPEQDVIKHMNNYSDFGYVYIQSFHSLKAPTPSIIINKKILDEHTEFKFPEDMKYAQDSFLWSKISFYYPLGLLAEPLIKVRQRGTNADLSSLIRFQAKDIVRKKIKNNELIKVDYLTKLILSYYSYGNRVLNLLKLRFKIGKGIVEILGKILWLPPFIVERLYVFYLKRNNKKELNFICKY
jgi:glycosyltransferase involved in cell wall biosynthesis